MSELTKATSCRPTSVTLEFNNVFVNFLSTFTIFGQRGIAKTGALSPLNVPSSLHSLLLGFGAPVVPSRVPWIASPSPQFFSLGVVHTFYIGNIGTSQILHRREFSWFPHKQDCSLILEFRVSGF